MNARKKLNIAVINGCLLVAAWLGWAARSWSLFFIAACGLAIAALYRGDIRPGADKRPRAGKRRQ